MNDFREYRGYCKNTYDDIAHFGILGMKWGIRRYQNPDGTLTTEGKRRYSLNDSKAYGEYQAKRRKINEDTEKSGLSLGLGSIVGGVVATLSIPTTGPLALTGAALGIGGMLASAAIMNKIGNKRIDTLKKSYGKERIDKAEKSVKTLSQANSMKAMFVINDKGSVEAHMYENPILSDALYREYGNKLLKGEITLDDIEKELQSNAKIDKYGNIV